MGGRLKSIGIRREDKNIWERRVPIIPDNVKRLKEDMGIITYIQPSEIRVFNDDEFRDVGAIVQENLDTNFIFGIKEMPVNFFSEGKAYIFFSHTIKGQPYNMPMLKKILEKKDTLIDYEKVADESGRRLIAFGRFAGIAGMIDTLWALGRRWEWEGYKTPFKHIKRAYEYHSLSKFESQSKVVGEEIVNIGFPEEISPVVIGIAGYGNVSKGAQEVLSMFPVKEISPQDLFELKDNNKIIYKVVFKEEHTVERKDGGPLDLQEFYQHPEPYKGVFEKHIDYISAFVNSIYWEKRYPRLITKRYIKENYSENMKMKVVGDISCDIEGAIEFTLKSTNPGEPVYVYNPDVDNIIMGYKAKGPVVLAVDILGSELPKDASIYFSKILMNFLTDIVNSEYPDRFEECTLPDCLKKAVIVYKGSLTSNYEYLKQYI